MEPRRGHYQARSAIYVTLTLTLVAVLSAEMNKSEALLIHKKWARLCCVKRERLKQVLYKMVDFEEISVDVAAASWVPDNVPSLKDKQGLIDNTPRTSIKYWAVTNWFH